MGLISFALSVLTSLAIASTEPAKTFTVVDEDPALEARELKRLGTLKVEDSLFDVMEDKAGEKELFLRGSDGEPKVKINRRGIYLFRKYAFDEALEGQGFFNVGLAGARFWNHQLVRTVGTPSHEDSDATFEFTLSFRPWFYKHLQVGHTWLNVDDPNILSTTSSQAKDLEAKSSFVGGGKYWFGEHDLWAWGGDHSRSWETDYAFAVSAGLYTGTLFTNEVQPKLVVTSDINGEKKHIAFTKVDLSPVKDRGFFIRQRIVLSGGNVFVRYDHGTGEWKIKRFTVGATFGFFSTGGTHH